MAPQPMIVLTFSRHGKRVALMGALWLALAMCAVHAQEPSENLAAALKARHAALKGALAQNQFQRPIHLVSTQTSNELKGEVFAVLDHSFASVSPALQARENWCDILILHLNVKQCQANKATGLTLHVGKKFDQPLSDAYRVDFNHHVTAHSAGLVQVQLQAAEGPLGTRNYQILLEAIPLDEKRSFVHMSYSYAYGMAARMAMQAYLATIGSDKVGFSVVGRRPDGQPVYVGNVRGVVERNTMRYYLAIEAYLNALSVPPGQQLNKRLHDWFEATERYPLQLHEMSESDYLAMKAKEVRRQQQP